MLFMQSGLLLLDEPTNHIDETALDWLTTFLQRSRASMIIVSHVQDFLDRIINKTMYLDCTTLRSYPGNYSSFLRLSEIAARQEEARQKQIAEEIAHQEKFIRGASQSRATQKHERQRKVRKLKQELTKRGTRKKTMGLRFPLTHPAKDILIEGTDLSKSFGSLNLFSHLSVTVGPRDHVLLDGPNGAGKTTLLRILSGVVRPDKGEVKRSRALQLGWYQQEQEGLNEGRMVLEEALSVADHMPVRQLRSILAHFLFPAEMVNQKVVTLSRGEKARLALCKIMLSGPNLLLLDEPSNHLDQPSRQQLKQALRSYEGAIVIATHDSELIEELPITRRITLGNERSDGNV